jgi:hypothetical protein
MRWLAGQARRGIGRALHAALHIALGFAVVMAVAAVLLVWRLSQGPVVLDSLTPRLNERLNADFSPLHVHVGSVALAWEGWRDGLERPVDFRLGGLTLAAPNGAMLAQIPRAGVQLSFGWLLLGRVVPRVIEIEGAHLELVREADGSLSLGFGPTAEDIGSPGAGREFAHLVDVLGRPRQDDSSPIPPRHPRWTQLRRVHVTDADLTIVDRRLGTVWHAVRADLDLRRHRAGGLTAMGALSLAVAGQMLNLRAEALLPPGDQGAAISARFGPVQPATLAQVLPKLAGLASPLEAPVQGTISAAFGPAPGSGSFAWRGAALRAQLGPGAIRVGSGAVPILSASMVIEAGPDRARLTRLRLVLAGREGAGPVVQGRGEVARRAGHLVGALEAETGQVPAADLARWWPAGVAKGARQWLITNLTAGIARSARVAVTFRADPDGSNFDLTGAKGRIAADNLTIHWLRPVPPAEGVRAELDLLSPDALLITTQGGREAGPARHAIVGRTGTVKITGLMAKDQVANIGMNLVGAVPDVLALLKHPRLHLLAKHPIELRNPSGQVTAELSVKLPLDARVTFDQIAIAARGKLSALHLGSVMGKADLNGGLFDMKVDNEGLEATGSGDLGPIPADIGVQMDFRAGPPTQVLRRYTVAATAEASQLAALGLDPGDVLSGNIGLRASLAERRNGSGEADVETDLRQAELAVSALGWRKPRGQPASASARVVLVRDRIQRIEGLSVEGDGLSLAGDVIYAAGRPGLIRLDRMVLGQTRGAGQIELPAGPDDPIRVRLAGSSLDLSGRLVPAAKRARLAGARESARDEPWIADLRFTQVLLGQGRMLSEVTAQAESEGGVIRRARLDGTTGGNGRFLAAISPAARNSRSISVRAADAGGLLRALNVLSNIDGGALALSGSYDDNAPGHPLSGRAELDSFRVRDAPAATRVLEGMTLYGAISALRGPGLGVARLIAPFRLTGSVLQLDDTRAFSPSLGFTARGWIDLDRRLTDMRGTIVPAYFFNSLLGHIPLLGALFSPEKGGGLFAATYAVRGRLDDPSVTINPLAALTPGFLRGLFGVFGGGNEPARSAAAR